MSLNAPTSQRRALGLLLAAFGLCGASASVAGVVGIAGIAGIASIASIAGSASIAHAQDDGPARTTARPAGTARDAEATDEQETAEGEGAAVQAGGSVNGSVSGSASASSSSAGSASAQVGAQTEASPWGQVEAAPLPAFLDTTDNRIVDERPPPSPEQVAALREMEAEVGRFARVGDAYRDTVLSMVRRQYQQQRRARSQTYARQIREEERLQNEARERAIRLFERFIERYPNDPRYTPDAMFRLGELYFERSALQFQTAFEDANAARDRGETPPPTPDTPDYNPTINIYQRLVENFSDYGRLDGVYYLIGYCLNEMGRIEEARLAWLSLVCQNHFKYSPSQFAAERQAEADAMAAEDNAVPDRAPLTLDAEDGTSGPGGAFANPYMSCQPVKEDAGFLSETWFRIGEYHFDDYGGEHALELAIAAYGKILETPEDRNYNLALYKVAWAYYRASRYPEAVRHFSMLVQWSDDERARTGRAGSDLRPEAIQYLGIAFAYDDWNENQLPDPIEGMPTGIQRVQDQNLMPQDKEWTAEVYFQLGNVYFDENKLPEAIEIWQIALRRWPMHERAPEITNLIARAHVRNQEMEAAIAWRARLGDFAEGSQWWNDNVEHPTEQREAEQLAENALIGTALYYHQQAQELRRRCVAEQNLDLCAQAQENYRAAAQGYRGYLDRYPNNPQAYDLRYNLADALYWSEEYEKAATEYAAVRDSNLDNKHLSESARRVVESVKRIVDLEEARGAVEVRTEPPEPSGNPPTVMPIAMPQLVQRLAQARELYVARVPEREDRENVRAAYDYNNTLLLYAYGYWPQAKERFRRIFEERCKGPYADETGRVAWTNLRNMAVTLGNTDEVRVLGEELTRRQCTFSPDGTQGAVDCQDPDNADDPRCIAEGDLTNLRYQDALNVFRQAEAASGDEQIRLYERSATLLVRAVNDEPNHPEAPIALEQAAVALERTSRFESAARLYQRIVDEVGPREPRNDEEKASLDAILANAYFRLAYNANRFFQFERAVENYRLLADNRRFERSQDETIKARRADALINAAIILERLQQYKRAAEYYDRAAGMLEDPAGQRNARFRVAEMEFKRGNWGGSIKAMQDFIGRYGNDRGAGELVVLAYWRVAQARKNARQSSSVEKALRDVVSAYGRSGQAQGSMAAEYAASANFELVDGDIASFENFKIDPGKPKTLQAYVQTLTKQIDSGSTRAQGLVQGYEPVTGYGRPTWTIAAFVRQGRVYEVLAKAILNAPFVIPADMQKQIRQLGPDARDQIQLEVEGAVQQVLDQKVRPVECFAVARYALAARAARAGSLDNEYTRIAVDRLQAYGDERIAECIAEAQRQDASFQPYAPGEFARAPRGLTQGIPDDVAAPSLERGQ